MRPSGLEHRQITCSPDLNDWFGKQWEGIEQVFRLERTGAHWPLLRFLELESPAHRPLNVFSSAFLAEFSLAQGRY